MDNNVRLIDANALIQDAEDVLNFSMLDRINRAETIDPDSLRAKGRWIAEMDTDDEWGEMEFHKCSVCGMCQWWETNYCPNCGAKMEG